MKLTRESYTISRATLKKVMEALAAHHTGYTFDDQEDNNDDVIEADELLQAEVDAQEKSK